MTHDTNIYKDPHLFIPQRHLPLEHKDSAKAQDFTFGFGKRICLGLHLANAQILFVTQLSLELNPS
ncbi:hypothetical protein K503DRAFT_768761 [Rhizopogon vinicolor AM-OR11-026]|uniref:Cytochrome P450 n=1 Tax=Rhizopogon vinicolor AM-OR11-026 TaxID=1314800 RepID=A0A1B7N608_9AGAM|nr:hypothetical protein K503DRAFT_768761 [Rhizopogon vinicolor AM-OR11-026]